MGYKNSNDFSLDQSSGLLSIGSSGAGATTNFQGMNNYQVGCIYSSTASATDANTTAETSLVGSGEGTITLPANFLVAGKTIRIRAEGHIANLLTPTLRLRINLGSTLITDTGAQTLSAITGTMRFIFESLITCRTTGAGGTVFSQGEFRYFTSAVAMVGNDAVATAATTLDTTASNAIDFTATWGTASSSNTITCTNFIIEVLV